MRCPKCRTLTLLSAGEIREAGSLVRCPRCPAAWIARHPEDGAIDFAMPPPVTRRGPLIIEGEAMPARIARHPPPLAAGARVGLRRYGIAAGAAALMLALVAVVLLAPDVSALPDVALLEGSR